MGNSLINGAQDYSSRMGYKRGLNRALPTTLSPGAPSQQTGSLNATNYRQKTGGIRSSLPPPAPVAGQNYGPLFNNQGVYDPSTTLGAHTPNTDKGAFQYVGQPNGTPGVPNTGSTVSAANRTGIIPSTYKTADQIRAETIAGNPLLQNDKSSLNAALGMTGLYGGDPNSTMGSTVVDYLNRNQGQAIDPIYQAVLQKKAGMNQGDFGIPDNVLNAMKVKEAQTINSGYAAQRDAAKRAMARAGLLSDSAMIENEQNINQQRLGEIFKAYTDLDSQNALKRNESYNKNLNEVLDAALGKSKFGEEQRNANLNSFGLVDQLLGKNKELASKYLSSRGEAMSDLNKQYDAGMESRVGILDKVAQYLDDLDYKTRMPAWVALQNGAQQYATNQTNMTNQATNANR